LKGSPWLISGLPGKLVGCPRYRREPNGPKRGGGSPLQSRSIARVIFNGRFLLNPFGGERRTCQREGGDFSLQKMGRG